MNGLAALAAWTGLDVERSVRSAAAKEQQEPLAVIPSCLRSDPRLNEEAAAALDQIVKGSLKGVWQTSDDPEHQQLHMGNRGRRAA